jgi:hypothetical protein
VPIGRSLINFSSRKVHCERLHTDAISAVQLLTCGVVALCTACDPHCAGACLKLGGATCDYTCNVYYGLQASTFTCKRTYIRSSSCRFTFICRAPITIRMWIIDGIPAFDFRIWRQSCDTSHSIRNKHRLTASPAVTLLTLLLYSFELPPKSICNGIRTVARLMHLHYSKKRQTESKLVSM